MELDVVLTKRKSCRKYIDKEINQQDIDKILWAGSRAPYASGGPRREFHYISDPKLKEKLCLACHGQKYVGTCATVMIICGLDENVKLRSGFPKYVHDCDAATMCMILKAEDLNIGNVWIGHFKPDEVIRILNLKSKPVVILLLGYKG